MNADHQKLAFACASAQWTPAANGTHILGRGFEVGRFADKRARDLAVDAVTALPDIVGRVETLELENETLRAALAETQARAGAMATAVSRVARAAEILGLAEACEDVGELFDLALDARKALTA